MTADRQNWQRMRFKKNKVWLALGKDGRPLQKNGKVLIKYQLDQDHQYWVNQQNVNPLDHTAAAVDLQNDKPPKNETSSLTRRAVEKKPQKTSASEAADAIHVYTDGASAGNPGPSGIGIVLRYGKHEKEISRYIGLATNNIAELEAIREALKQIKHSHIPVRVFTDSSYAHGVLSLGWKARKNKELVQSIKHTMSAFEDIKLIKIRGHAGIEHNERADFLATSAIDKAVK
jgi:ribonuclease HI